jgi:hypothetical protein
MEDGQRRLLSAALLGLLALWISACGAEPAHAELSSQQVSDLARSVSIDQTLFVSTVPSYAILGHNYTVLVDVTNTSNQSIPITLRVDAPIDIVYTYPVYLQVVVGAYSTLDNNFTLMAFNTTPALLNVTVTMWIWFTNQMPRPVVAQQLSTVIAGVVHSHQSQDALILVAVVSTTVVVLAAGFYLARNRRRP